MTTPQPQTAPPTDPRPQADSHGMAPTDAPDMPRIVAEEERVLQRVTRTVAQQAKRPSSGHNVDYASELLSLRDQIMEARLEDVPPLVEEMERLQRVAAQRGRSTEGQVDLNSPYFGRMVLEEGERRREVLIGRSTYLAPRTGIRIVDWRDAPVSRIYYRYDEGDDYDEVFGGREVQGEVLVRRSLAIIGARLQRITAPQGTFVRRANAAWQALSHDAQRLTGGQGAALRPEAYHRPGKLGGAAGKEDRRLSEITALIDARQFELIARPTTGLVVIQGGAGSGKTTIGLHRLAYLNFQDRTHFAAHRMLVVVFNDALARYIARVLPALGVADVPVTTFTRWARKLRQSHVPGLARAATEDTPAVVRRFKKHPAMLALVDQVAGELSQGLAQAVQAILGQSPEAAAVTHLQTAVPEAAFATRLQALQQWLQHTDSGRHLRVGLRHSLERSLSEYAARARDIVHLWADMLTDQRRLHAVLARHAAAAFSEKQRQEIDRWCRQRVQAVLRHQQQEATETEAGGPQAVDHAMQTSRDEEDEEAAALDLEDDALLLRLVQRVRGPLRRKQQTLHYSHVFVDEAQDLSPVELAVVMDTVSQQRSVTLAGDVAQRILLDNSFGSWRDVLHHLGLDHVEVEPLKLSYRSTAPILEFASAVLGPLDSGPQARQATRTGAGVELFAFAHAGDAVGFLAEHLRALMQGEPLASVAVIARYPEQADLYYQGLQQAEVPFLRRIAEQDFPFRPGVDVTDVGQVKGLEFDYVIIVECTAATFPEDDAARHLLHIAATRAAHQLWLLTTGEPSPLLPASLRG
ncbi:MAG: UvrD-helicase domain-containing protein [Polyangiales bacterium]